jgi:(-)-trans-carveol dehydrogenase
MAVELGPERIRVNSIHSTNVDTPMIQNPSSYRVVGIADAPGARSEFARVSSGMNLLPVPWIEAQDVSNAVLFLASDEASCITGVTLPVDAGFLEK